MEYAGLQPEWFLPSSELPPDDQRWLYYYDFSDCNPIREIKESESRISGDGNNGGCKPNVNAEQTLNYLNAISQLKGFNYQTAPIEISKVLEVLFGTDSKDGHWLWIAQRWCPRPMVQVLIQIVKEINRGQINPRSPAGYFTYLIKFRKRRKRARGRVKP